MPMPYTLDNNATTTDTLSSNTTAQLFLEYAQAVNPFREIWDEAQRQGKTSAVDALERFPPNATCELALAADMLRQLTTGLHGHDRIQHFRGEVLDVKWDAETSRWQVKYLDADGQNVGGLASPMVVFCTGSTPKVLSFNREEPTTMIPLMTALSPTELQKALPPTPQTPDSTSSQLMGSERPLVVGVVGASHSAILVLKNLVTLAATSHQHFRVLWFTRHAKLRYAEARKGGWILHDNTGLKGEAADFARDNLDGDKLMSGPAANVITQVDCSAGGNEMLSRLLKECDFAVQAIGFKKSPIRLGWTWPDFDHTTGRFQATDFVGGRKVYPQGMFGAGIAFPERVVDPEGNQEFAVGFWKFMKFLKRVVPDWVASVSDSLQQNVQSFQTSDAPNPAFRKVEVPGPTPSFLPKLRGDTNVPVASSPPVRASDPPKPPFRKFLAAEDRQLFLGYYGWDNRVPESLQRERNFIRKWKVLVKKEKDLFLQEQYFSAKVREFVARQQIFDAKEANLIAKQRAISSKGRAYLARRREILARCDGSGSFDGEPEITKQQMQEEINQSATMGDDLISEILNTFARRGEEEKLTRRGRKRRSEANLTTQGADESEPWPLLPSSEGEDSSVVAKEAPPLDGMERKIEHRMDFIEHALRQGMRGPDEPLDPVGLVLLKGLRGSTAVPSDAPAKQEISAQVHQVREELREGLSGSEAVSDAPKKQEFPAQVDPVREALLAAMRGEEPDTEKLTLRERFPWRPRRIAQRQLKKARRNETPGEYWMKLKSERESLASKVDDPPE